MGERRRLPGLALVLALAVVITVAGCPGATRSGSGDEPASGGGVAATDHTRSTEPPGTDPDTVRGYVDALLRRYDESVNAIVADPAVVSDRSDPVVAGYVELFEPGSGAVGAALAGWGESAETGLAVRPLRTGAPMIVTGLSGGIETVDADEVRFATCADHQYQQYVHGDLEDVVDMARAGEGVAVRVDGHWRLRRLELRDDRTGCATEEDGT